MTPPSWLASAQHHLRRAPDLHPDTDPLFGHRRQARTNLPRTPRLSPRIPGGPCDHGWRASLSDRHCSSYAAGRLWAVAEAVDGRLGTCFLPQERERYKRILVSLHDDARFRAGEEAGTSL